MSSPDQRAAWVAMQQALIDDVRANGKPVSGPFAGRDVLLLTAIGARTGTRRTTPLAFTRDGKAYVIVASKGGAPDNPSWYHNLLANPEVTVETGGETFQARATPAEGADRDRLYQAHAAVFPSFDDYQRRTERVIPVFRLERL